MSGLNSILEIARRALQSQQTAMSVTSHNVSNANTEGYSRQRADLAATTPLPTIGGLLGTGVNVTHIGRIREAFIDQQIRGATDTLNASTTEQRILSQVEASLNEPSDSGLNAVMNKFFSSFQDLSTHPEDSSTRNAVVHQAALLTQSFHRLSSGATQLRNDLLNDLNDKVDRINQLANDIGDLDMQITNLSSNGVDASDLKDQRDSKIDELSGLATIKSSEDAQGSVMVSIGGTVIASRAGSVALKSVVTGGQAKVQLAQSGQDVQIGNGDVGAILKSYNVTLPGFGAKLDSIASALITRVNSLHSAGFGLGSPPPTGNPFFTGTNAGDIEVDSGIQANVDTIAASTTGAAGDNQVALALANVANDNLVDGNTKTVVQAYNGLVSDIGATVQSADSTAKAQQMIVQQLEGQRSSVSGVSLDEEMTNLVKYQRAYDAAARVVNSVADMYDTIINMKQ